MCEFQYCKNIYYGEGVVWRNQRRDVSGTGSLLASHDVAQIDGCLSLGKYELEETEGLSGWTSNPTCCEPDQEHAPLMGKAGVLLLSKRETIHTRISHPTKEGHREAE